MNPQQEAIALWRYIESRGHKPTRRAIAMMLRSWGLRFRDADLNAWLAPFRERSRNQSGTDAEPSGNQKTSTREPNGNHDGTNAEPSGNVLRARAAKVSLFTKSVLTDDSLRSSSSAQHAVPAEPTRKPKAPRLPLDAEVQIAKNAILDAVWPLLAPTLSRAKNKTTWKRENARVATELAHLGRTPDEAVSAWHRASERLGAPCRTMRIVQDELARMDSGEGAADCGCGLGRFDCDRLHEQHNTTTDLLPTIAELEATCSL